jgi:hypothetical protein
MILFWDLPYWQGQVPNPPTNIDGLKTLSALTIFFHLSIQACLAINWILFFQRSQLIKKKKLVIAAIVTIICFVVAIFAVHIASFSSDPLSGQKNSLVAVGLTIAATGLWALLFLVIGITLFLRIRAITLESSLKKYLMVKLLLGTAIGVSLALAYSLYVLLALFIYPPLPPPFDPNGAIRTSVMFTWVTGTLVLLLAVDMVWLIRPTHEFESKVSSADHTKSKVAVSSFNSAISKGDMSHTMDIDD